MAFDPPGDATRHRRLALRPDTADDAARFGPVFLVPVHGVILARED
jgi:hypothetical protein